MIKYFIRSLCIPVSFVLCFMIAGCCGQCGPDKQEKKVLIAKINNYELSDEDFRNEAGPALMGGYMSEHPAKAKEDMLNSIIAKKVLLQEAQEQNFDKDRYFMKEIERYWEQALLKLILKKKSQEISNSIHVTDGEIRREYNHMKRKILADVVVLKSKKAAETLASDVSKFDVNKASVKDEIMRYDTEWLVVGDLSPDMEEALFSLKPGQMAVIEQNGPEWVVLRSIEETPIEVDPLEKMTPQIRSNIISRKRALALDGWITNLVKHAKVKIYKKNLNDLVIR